MAKVIVDRAWEHGADRLTVKVIVDDSFPDVVAEAVTNAVNGYARSLKVTLSEDLEDLADVAAELGVDLEADED